MAWNVEPDLSDSGFAEASKWFRSKLPVTEAEWEGLSERARQRAFSVGGITQLDMVQEVWDAIDDAIAKGSTLEEFKESVGDKLASAWGGESPWRIESIFRTNVQTAYNAGRYEQQQDPDVIALRPYLKYSAILDSRTTPECRAAHGTILPASHPWWLTHQPPLRWNCRATAVSLTEEQAREMGGETSSPTDVMGAPGFGAPPKLEWAPDMGRYDAELAGVLLERAG